MVKIYYNVDADLEIIKDIQIRRFAKEWVGNLEESKAKLNALMRDINKHGIESR